MVEEEGMCFGNAYVNTESRTLKPKMVRGINLLRCWIKKEKGWRGSMDME